MRSAFLCRGRGRVGAPSSAAAAVLVLDWPPWGRAPIPPLLTSASAGGYDWGGVIAQPSQGGGEHMHSFFDFLQTVVAGLWVRVLGDWLHARFWRR